jgi:hypothetical protein
MNPLTPLELLSIIEQSHNFESPSLRLALTELEVLKRDVKRYFELRDKGGLIFGSDESVEMYRLREKLMKVGTEE